jgi:thiamine-phosphate pyrophosphorylase
VRGGAGLRGVDLIGLSPAFDTATKPDAGAGLGLDGVRALAAQAGLPSVAIGGIDVARAALLRGSGVAGVCVVSAICCAADPQATASALYAAFAGGALP